MPADFTVGFDMIPGTNHERRLGQHHPFHGHQRQLLQLRRPRIPAAWLYVNTRHLHIRDGSTGNGNNGCDPEM